MKRTSSPKATPASNFRFSLPVAAVSVGGNQMRGLGNPVEMKVMDLFLDETAPTFAVVFPPGGLDRRTIVRTGTILVITAAAPYWAEAAPAVPTSVAAVIRRRQAEVDATKFAFGENKSSPSSGMWTTRNGTRGTKADSVEGEYGFPAI
jgi:hypothetical protein